MGNRHHFVPRFYLKPFISAPRRLHLFNIQRRTAVSDVSLRDQCYAHRLYGKDDSIENAFAEIEEVTSQIFSIITTHQALPGLDSPEHTAVLMFIALQLARTIAARDSAIALSTSLGNAAFEGQPPLGFVLTPEQAVSVMLGAAPGMARTLSDLSVALVQAPPRAPLITSDNPAFLYNSYCEGMRYAGVTGTKCRGLQVFLPLSPEFLLHLYDGGVYKVGTRRGGHVIDATIEDVNALNRLQFMSAHHNVYFHDWRSATGLSAMCDTVTSLRAGHKPRVNRAVNEQDDRSELLHQYWPMPQLKLRLSFLSIQRKAKRTPLFSRAHQIRDRYARIDRPQDSREGTWQRFVVRSRH